MKILFISECYPSEQQPQYCIFLEQQAQALQKLGNSVEILVPKAGIPCGIGADTRKGLTVYSMNYTMSFTQKACGVKLISEELRTFLKTEKYDIVAIQIVSLALQLEIERASHQAGSAVVLHYHGLNIWADYYPTHPLYEKVILPTKVKLSKKMDGIVCVSQSVLNVFRERNQTTPAYVIYNGVDLSLFSPNPQKNNAVFTVLCVANLIRIKGQEFLIRAIAELKSCERPVRLQLIGDGPERQNLCDLAASLGVQDDVEFLGTLPYETVAKYMANADMFILPSYFDASPCVCYEAMASGILTCACNVYGPSELISNMETGLLVEPKSSQALTDAISFAMDHPEEVKGIVDRGIETASCRTWDISAKTLNMTYLNIAAKSNTI